eukprot:m.460975 g.460975  ORF g.460975 m.460975 type:complete len:469 (+) comp22183_c0_seq1:66-1472(+)
MRRAIAAGIRASAGLQQIASVRIVGLDPLGRGVGVAADDDTQLIVVPFTVPGDSVATTVPIALPSRPSQVVSATHTPVIGDAEEGLGNEYSGDLTADLADVSFATATCVEVLKPSPDRTTPHCIHFGVCNGCQLQHMTITAQRQWKRNLVVRYLSSLNELRDQIELIVHPVVGNDVVYEYRTKLTPHHQRPNQNTGEIGPIGFLQVGPKRATVDISECPIATAAINVRLPLLRQEARDIAHAEVADGARKRRLRGKTLLLRDSGSGDVQTDPRHLISTVVNGITFEYIAGQFFQNNASLLPALVRHVVNEIGSNGANLLVDCYCGGGLFALSAANRFQTVIGVETSSKNVAFARRNAENNNITNATFIEGDAKLLSGPITEMLQSTGKDYASRTAVVIDPPRKGCSADFIRQLCDFGPSTIVYVSCNPESLARDAAALVKYYTPVKVVPFDMFPQTRHVESVATFYRC